MTILLVTNDDGVESPALSPLIHALARHPEVGRVNTLVPDRERSWISKAITRFEDIEVRSAEEVAAPDRAEVLKANAFPADCVNLGIHSVFEERPDYVVSGINVGCNHGLAFLLGSGTVGAASEGFIAGIPAIAFSMGEPGNHARWVKLAHSPEGEAMWQRAAEVAADILGEVIGIGFPEDVDLINVNMPHDVNLDSPRVVTEIADLAYDGLFSERRENVYFHDYPGTRLRRTSTSTSTSDLEALERGAVSITPVHLPRSAAMSDELRGHLER